MAAGMTDITSSDTAGAPRRRRTALFVALGVGAIVVVLVVVFATAPPATTRVTRSPLVGRQVPPVVAETIDGDRFDLDELRGQWVVLNVFATWCVPCREEHPDLVRFDRRHRTIGDASVVGLVYDDDPAAVRSFRAAEGGEWPMLLDPDGRIAVSFGVAGVPESFLIAPDGTIAAKVTGGVRETELDALLDQFRTPPPPEDSP
jgi:cytochrome c biogenesis protein CcmG, thiol:disulfide interchange protein DsbE